MSNCVDCGRTIRSGGRCQICRVEHQYGGMDTLTGGEAHDAPDCVVCGNIITPEAMAWLSEEVAPSIRAGSFDEDDSPEKPHETDDDDQQSLDGLDTVNDPSGGEN